MNVAGVIVTYFPNARFDARLAAIARETNPLIVVDNSAEPAVHTRLQKLCAAHGATFVASPANVGIGAALNRAFEAHAAAGIEWCIAFDQDSTPAPGFTAALLAAAGNPAPAVVGANWHDEARPDHAAALLLRGALPPFFTRRVADRDLDDVTCVITSGSLFHLPTWRQLGGFDEALFLDLVDTDYCLRAQHAGRAVRVAAAAKLAHRRGAKRPVTRFGRTSWPAFMPPFRLRLLFRNRLRLFRRYALRAPHWVAFELVYATKIVTEIVFLEDDKAAKLAACVRGTWDGLLGRGGPVP